MIIGSVGRASAVVHEKNTAKAMGSGSLDVFATPALVALMEEAAVHGLQLSREQTTVGISIDLKHMAATPLGMNVWAEAVLTEMDRRKLTFQIKAYDERGLIGEGRHERFLVAEAEFMKKTMEKLKKSDLGDKE